MKVRKRRFEEGSPVEFLLLRQKLGLGRYRKRVRRNEEEKKLLLHIGLKKIEEKERDDFTPIGYRRRKVKIFPESSRESSGSSAIASRRQD